MSQRPIPLPTHVEALAEYYIHKAIAILDARIKAKGVMFLQVADVTNFLRLQLESEEREVFAVLFLDNQHRLIEFKRMFFGTINTVNVHPREVVKEAIKQNAAAVIFAHNHPSGLAEPSKADRDITVGLTNALALVDVRTLDHVVIGHGQTISFAERGWV